MNEIRKISTRDCLDLENTRILTAYAQKSLQTLVQCMVETETALVLFLL